MAYNKPAQFRHPLDMLATRRKYVPVGSVAASLPQHGRHHIQRVPDLLAKVVRGTQHYQFL